MKFFASYPNDPSSEEEYETFSPRKAAELFFKHHTEAPPETTWGIVHVSRGGGLCTTCFGRENDCRDCHGTGEMDVDEGNFTIALHPEEPACLTDHKHDWQAPISIVGGAADNPGVILHGEGAKYASVCARCGFHRVIDSWATNSDTGEPRLPSICYIRASDLSLAWVKSLRGKP